MGGEPHMKKDRIQPRASLPPQTCCRRQDDAVAMPPAFANRPLSAHKTPHVQAHPPPTRPLSTTAAYTAAAATAARRGGRNSGPHRRGGGERQLAGRRGKPLWRRVGRAPPPALRRRGARLPAGTRRQRRPRPQWGVRQKRRRRRWRRRPRFSHGRQAGSVRRSRWTSLRHASVCSAAVGPTRTHNVLDGKGRVEWEKFSTSGA